MSRRQRCGLRNPSGLRAQRAAPPRVDAPPGDSPANSSAPCSALACRAGPRGEFGAQVPPRPGRGSHLVRFLVLVVDEVVDPDGCPPLLGLFLVALMPLVPVEIV